MKAEYIDILRRLDRGRQSAVGFYLAARVKKLKGEVDSLAESVEVLEEGGLPRTVSTDAEVTLAAEWNHKYVFGDTLTELTVTLPTAPTERTAEVIIVINCGSTIPVLTLPDSVTVDGDDLTANERYELSIDEDGIGYAKSVAVVSAG